MWQNDNLEKAYVRKALRTLVSCTSYFTIMSEEILYSDSKMKKFVREINSFLNNATVLTMQILSSLNELL